MQTSVELLWKRWLEHSPVTSFQIVDHLLIALVQKPGNETSASYLMAVDIADGSVVWTKELNNVVVGGLQVSTSPEDGHYIYVTASNRDFLLDEAFVQCYDAHGSLRWQWHGEAQTISEPGLYGEKLIFTVNSEHFIQLNAFTGQEVASLSLEKPASFAAPYWDKETAYIPGRGSHLTAVDSKTQQQTHYHLKKTGWLNKTPILAGETIVTVGRKGHLIAINPADGSNLWRIKVDESERPLSSPTIAEGLLYVGAKDGLHALNLEDGQRLWSFQTERSVTAQPVVHDQVVYITCHDHYIYAIDAQNGQEQWRYQMERLIEVPPLVRAQNDNLVIIFAVDRGGQIIALEQQLASAKPAAISDAAAELKTKTENIKQLESDGDLTRAAEAWYEKGDFERAAEQFELAGKWQRAAELWFQLGRLLQYAEALEGHALAVEDADGDTEERKTAWHEAAQAYEAEGEWGKFEFCLRKVAQYDLQPILDLNLEHDGFVLNTWSRVKLTVFNNGFGPARRLDILASGEQFKGQVASSKYFFKLPPDNKLDVILSIRPLQYGEAVPLKVAVAYQDNKMKMQRIEKTIFVPVASERSNRKEGQITHVFTTTLKPGPGAGASGAESIDLVEMRRHMAVSFNINDLKDVCFEVDIDPEELTWIRKSEFIREMILYLERRGRLPDLLALCQQLRPHIDWYR